MVVTTEKLPPIVKYERDLASGQFQPDAAQRRAVEALQRLYDDLLVSEQHHQGGWLRRLKQRIQGAPAAPKGIYFWGGVGRGKTYLVDTFFDSLPFNRKLRLHFHRFMHRIHDELKALKGRSDPLPIIADKLALEARVLCFDEFFVQDITDAMILGTLMQELFARGVVLVATSNIVPDDLYRNGLQRQRFIPAIEQIKLHCDVINVDSGIDYRLRTLTQAQIYHTPADAAADASLQGYFHQLVPNYDATDAATEIEINHRTIPIRMVHDGVIMFSFSALCETARSQNDYIEIAQCYHTVLISDVPQMGAHNDDAARRFIALVDEFYERRVKLIMSATVPLDQLYSQGTLNFEFKRCISRLREMQSHEYLGLAHKS